MKIPVLSGEVRFSNAVAIHERSFTSYAVEGENKKAFNEMFVRFCYLRSTLLSSRRERGVNSTIWD